MGTGDQFFNHVSLFSVTSVFKLFFITSLIHQPAPGVRYVSKLVPILLPF